MSEKRGLQPVGNGDTITTSGSRGQGFYTMRSEQGGTMKPDRKNQGVMRKLVVISFLTLDGVMQCPGGKVEDDEGGFQYGGWQAPFFGEYDVLKELGKAGALLLGRKTYDIFAAYWPTVGKRIEGFGPVMNNITKY